MVVVLGLLPATLGLALIRHCSTIEEMIEKILRCHEIALELVSMKVMATSPTSLLLSLVFLLTTNLVVYASFVCICQARHRCVDFLESICGFGSGILIWVYFHSPPFICFLQIVFTATLFNTKDRVKIFATDNFIANLDIFFRKGPLILNRGC